MTSKETSALIDGITQWSEAMTGMRNQLINNGFSPEVAEQIVLEALRMGGAKENV